MSKRNLIFLSYAGPDLKVARKIYNGLTKRKLDVWFDKEHLKKGKWKRQIEEAIASSSNFLFCTSRASLKRHKKSVGFQCEEFNYAYTIAMNQPESSFTIIPLRLENCKRGDLRLSSYQQFNLFENFERTLDQLAVQLGGVSLGKRIVKESRTKEENIINSLFGKAAAEYSAQNYEKALKALRAIISLKPNDMTALSTIGVILGKTGKHAEAMKSFNEALEYKPNDLNCLINLGISFGELGENKKAIECFDKVLKLDPKNINALNERGRAFGKLGNLKEAMKNLKKVIQKKPNNIDAWTIIGTLYGLQGKHEEAIKCFNKGLKKNIDQPYLLFNRGIAFYNLRRDDDALRDLRDANKLDPDLSDALIYSGRILEKKGKQKKALEVYSKVIRAFPENLEAWNTRGMAFSILKRYREALIDFNEAIKLKADFAEAWFNRGLVFSKMGKLNKAESNFSEAIKLNPKNVNVWYNRGVILGKQKKYKVAALDFLKAIKIDPNYIDAWFNRGVVLDELGKRREALNCFNKVINLCPNDANAWLEKGLLQKKLGRLKAAKVSIIKSLSLSIEKHPESKLGLFDQASLIVKKH